MTHPAPTTPYGELVKPDAVHARVYFDPEIFSAEIERIFEREWIYVGHESEIASPGDVRRTNLGLQSVLFCRDRGGDVHVLYNRCRHRGATICQVESGNVDRFRCEYHGWTYGLDGALKTVPYADGYEELDRKVLSLSRPRSIAEYRGFYFACAKTPRASLEASLGEPVRAQIDLLCDQSPTGRISVRAGAARLTFAGNWKLQMENSIDGYHPNFTHQSWLQSIRNETGHRVAIFDGDSPARCVALGSGHSQLDYRAIYTDPRYAAATVANLQRSAAGRKYYDDLVDARGRERAEEVICMNGTHMSVFPNLVILNQQVRNIRPIDATRTDVDLAPALLEGVPDEINTARIRQFESFYSPLGGGIHDDIEMFERVTAGLRGSSDAWLVLQRGIGREERRPDGTIAGQVTDEVSQRAMWRHWLEVMDRDVAD